MMTVKVRNFEEALENHDFQGAGHFVPLSRPGPALQMITNFMFPFSSGSEYSSEKNIKPKPVVRAFLVK